MVVLVVQHVRVAISEFEGQPPVPADPNRPAVSGPPFERMQPVTRYIHIINHSRSHSSLRRRAARMRRIDGLRRVAEMFQNPLDDGGFLDAGDHPPLPAALAAGLDVDGKDPLEALRP